ncbi:MAG: hypothetical protein GY754_35190 [bacterium]|nr:hypothetical protein [bacterium]
MRNKKKIEFDQVDPFNPQNRVQGYIHRSKSRYGDMEITFVNDSPCKQYIFGTPKILNLEKNIHQIKFQKVKIYEKIDGTNILLYRYRDIRGKEFISYKTRLSPFLRAQPYGDFAALWEEILKKYNSEFSRLYQWECLFGFELFGSTLRILTDYDIDLDARLLYAIDPANGKIIDPEYNRDWNFPKARKIDEYTNDTPLSTIHSTVLDTCQKELALNKCTEGAMFYFFNDSQTTLYKCKPPEIITRQQRYGELYNHGRQLAKTTQYSDDILKDFFLYISENWPEELIQKYSRIIEIAAEDITNEVEFNKKNKPGIWTEQSTEIFNQKVLWRTVWGSHLWGMNNPESDEDCCVVYQIDSKTVFLGTTNKKLIIPHENGTRRKSGGNDEHWYELGRAVQLILKGSLTLLYGVMSPIVVNQYSTVLEELQTIIKNQPCKIFYKILLRDVRESEKAMKRAKDTGFYLKHLRIACRNLQFGITLFTGNTYEFLPSYTEDPDELERLRSRLIDVFEKSQLPDAFDPEPFEEYIIRWRKHRYNLDYAE